MKRNKLKFQFSSEYDYDATEQTGYKIVSYRFIPYDFSDMLLVFALTDDEEAFVFGFTSGYCIFGTLGPDKQYNKIKLVHHNGNATSINATEVIYNVTGMKFDIYDMDNNIILYDAIPITAYSGGDNTVAFSGIKVYQNNNQSIPEHATLIYVNGTLQA